MKHRSSKLIRFSLNIENSVFSRGKDFFLMGLDASYLATMQEYLSILEMEINHGAFAEIINNFLLFQVLHFRDE